MPKSARLERVAIRCNLERMVLSAEVDITDTDEPTQRAEVVVAKTERPQSHFKLLKHLVVFKT
jgi:hypothetical protein